MLPDLRPLFEEIGTALAETLATGDEGSAMRAGRATEIAQKIVALYSRVCAAQL